MLKSVVPLLDERTHGVVQEANRLPTVGPPVLSTFRKARLLEEGQSLKDERDTWLLLDYLHQHQEHQQNHVNQDPESLKEVCPRTLINALLVEVDLDQSPQVDLYKVWIIIRWLQELAKESIDTNCTSLNWSDSFHVHQSSADRNRSREMAVFTLDLLIPGVGDDALTSQQDIQCERVLLKSVWTLLRAGDLKQAIDLLQDKKQFWRAASLRGYHLYSDPRLDHEVGSFDNSDAPPEGNLNGNLWRQVCAAICQKPGLCEFEKAIYGFLSGQVGPVLPLCSTWHDYLWIHMTAYIERMIERHLACQDPASLYLNPLGADFGGPAHSLGSSDREFLTPIQIFEHLASNSDPSIQKQSKTVFARVQTMLMLSQRAALIARLCEWVDDPIEDSCTPILKRFAAHLALLWHKFQPLSDSEHHAIDAYLRPDLLTNPFTDWHTFLLGRYIQHLILTSHIELVAFYTHHLLEPEAQVAAFGSLLCHLTVNRRSEYIPFQECVELASRFDLPLDRIMEFAAHLISEGAPKAYEDLLISDPYLKDVAPLDRLRIEAVQWRFRGDHFSALVHSNTLTREFIREKKPLAARYLLFHVVPRDIALRLSDVPPQSSHTLVEDTIREYTAARNYFDAKIKFQDWREYPEVEKLEAVVDSILDILHTDGGWFHDKHVPFVQDDAFRIRYLQLQDIRAECIPELVFLLVEIYTDKRVSYLKEVLRLADIVADDTQHLYDAFSPQVMQQFLKLITNASLELLRLVSDPDPLGYFC